MRDDFQFHPISPTPKKEIVKMRKSSRSPKEKKKGNSLVSSPSSDDIFSNIPLYSKKKKSNSPKKNKFTKELQAKKTEEINNQKKDGTTPKKNKIEGEKENKEAKKMKRNKKDVIEEEQQEEEDNVSIGGNDKEDENKVEEELMEDEERTEEDENKKIVKNNGKKELIENKTDSSPFRGPLSSNPSSTATPNKTSFEKIEKPEKESLNLLQNDNNLNTSKISSSNSFDFQEINEQSIDSTEENNNKFSKNTNSLIEYDGIGSFIDLVDPESSPSKTREERIRSFEIDLPKEIEKKIQMMKENEKLQKKFDENKTENQTEIHQQKTPEKIENEKLSSVEKNNDHTVSNFNENLVQKNTPITTIYPPKNVISPSSNMTTNLTLNTTTNSSEKQKVIPSQIQDDDSDDIIIEKQEIDKNCYAFPSKMNNLFKYVQNIKMMEITDKGFKDFSEICFFCLSVEKPLRYKNLVENIPLFCSRCIEFFNQHSLDAANFSFCDPSTKNHSKTQKKPLKSFSAKELREFVYNFGGIIFFELSFNFLPIFDFISSKFSNFYHWINKWAQRSSSHFNVWNKNISSLAHFLEFHVSLKFLSKFLYIDKNLVDEYIKLLRLKRQIIFYGEPGNFIILILFYFYFYFYFYFIFIFIFIFILFLF